MAALPDKKKLPPVLPIVLSNGDKPWMWHNHYPGCCSRYYQITLRPYTILMSRKLANYVLFPIFCFTTPRLKNQGVPLEGIVLADTVNGYQLFKNRTAEVK